MSEGQALLGGAERHGVQEVAWCVVNRWHLACWLSEQRSPGLLCAVRVHAVRVEVTPPASVNVCVAGRRSLHPHLAVKNAFCKLTFWGFLPFHPGQ